MPAPRSVPEPRPMLTGRFVRLRAYEPVDADHLMTWVNDADFRQFLDLRYPHGRAQEVAWASQGGPTYLARISLWVHDGNDRARRSYEKAGFLLEGTARQADYARGRRHDRHLYGLLRDELRRND